MATITDDKEMFVEKVRATLAILVTVFVIGLSAAIIFGTIPQDNAQMANSIIMFLLGMLGGGCMAYYFNASPQSKKTLDTPANTASITNSTTDKV